MRYAIPALIQTALLVYALIDCIQTDSVLVRNLPKPLWVFLIILVPLVGPVAWLVAGRPERRSSRPQVAWPSTQTAGFPEYERPRRFRSPDDDDAFLASLEGPDPEKEELLRRWEEQLREREAAARAHEAATDPAPGPGTTSGTADDGTAEPDRPVEDTRP